MPNTSTCKDESTVLLAIAVTAAWQVEFMLGTFFAVRVFLEGIGRPCQLTEDVAGSRGVRTFAATVWLKLCSEHE